MKDGLKMKAKTEIVRYKETFDLYLHLENEVEQPLSVFLKLTGAAEAMLARERHRIANFIFADYPSPTNTIHHYIYKNQSHTGFLATY